MGWGKAEQVERELLKDGGNGNADEKNRQQKGLSKGLGQLRRRMEELAVARGESEEAIDDGNEEDEDEGEEDPMDPLTVLKNMGRQLKKEQEQLDGDDQKKRKDLEERRADHQRLERVELLYVSSAKFLNPVHPPHQLMILPRTSSHPRKPTKRCHCSAQTPARHRDCKSESTECCECEQSQRRRCYW
jgi:hypothetical protein